MMRNKQMTCTDCQGQGYLELLLGGTERCPRCRGTGEAVSNQPLVIGRSSS